LNAHVSVSFVSGNARQMRRICASSGLVLGMVRETGRLDDQ
jgi:hypothetical protein